MPSSRRGLHLDCKSVGNCLTLSCISAHCFCHRLCCCFTTETALLPGLPAGLTPGSLARVADVVSFRGSTASSTFKRASTELGLMTAILGVEGIRVAQEQICVSGWMTLTSAGVL